MRTRSLARTRHLLPAEACVQRAASCDRLQSTTPHPAAVAAHACCLTKPQAKSLWSSMSALVLPLSPRNEQTKLREVSGHQLHCCGSRRREQGCPLLVTANNLHGLAGTCLEHGSCSRGALCLQALSACCAECAPQHAIGARLPEQVTEEPASREPVLAACSSAEQVEIPSAKPYRCMPEPGSARSLRKRKQPDSR